MGKSSWAWKSFGYTRSLQDLNAYLVNREYEHGDYCHYAGLTVIESIITGREFWISNVDNFNDKMDSKQFDNNSNRFFSLCFSTGVHENLSLWYLYSGIDGKGARIRFNKSTIKLLLEKAEYSLYKRTKFSEKGLLIKKLDTEDIKVKFKDIIYYSFNDRKSMYDLKYNTLVNHEFPKDEFESYINDNMGFCKNLIWYYEKETRLLIELQGEVRNLVESDTDTIETEYGEKHSPYLIVMKIDSSVISDFKIDLAPETSTKDEPEFYDAIKNVSEFKLDNIRNSEYVKQIKMSIADKYKRLICSNCANSRDSKSQN